MLSEKNIMGLSLQKHYNVANLSKKVFISMKRLNNRSQSTVSNSLFAVKTGMESKIKVAQS